MTGGFIAVINGGHIWVILGIIAMEVRFAVISLRLLTAFAICLAVL